MTAVYHNIENFSLVTLYKIRFLKID